MKRVSLEAEKPTERVLICREKTSYGSRGSDREEDHIER